MDGEGALIPSFPAPVWFGMFNVVFDQVKRYLNPSPFPMHHRAFVVGQGRVGCHKSAQFDNVLNEHGVVGWEVAGCHRISSHSSSFNIFATAFSCL